MNSLLSMIIVTRDMGSWTPFYQWSLLPGTWAHELSSIDDHCHQGHGFMNSLLSMIIVTRDMGLWTPFYQWSLSPGTWAYINSRLSITCEGSNDVACEEGDLSNRSAFTRIGEGAGCMKRKRKQRQMEKKDGYTVIETMTCYMVSEENSALYGCA